MRIFPLLIITIALLLFSCQNKPDTKTYLSRIDSLEIFLEESASVYESIDTAMIRNQLAVIEEQIEQLKTFDNIDIVKPVTSYRIIKSAYGDFLKASPAVKIELSYTRSQLTDLRYDVENNQLSEEIATMYFDQEQQSVRVIKLKMDYYSNLVKSNSANYLALNTELNKLTDSLELENEFK